MPAPNLPRCPQCNQQSAHPSGRNYYCSNCRQEFDPTDDSDIGYGPPSRRIEREERRRAKYGCRR